MSSMNLMTYTPAQQHAGEFVRGFPWRLYCTGTFRRLPGTDEDAIRELHRFIRGLRLAFRFPRLQVAHYGALELKWSGLGHSGIRKHWHFLIACPDHPLLESVSEQLWVAGNGWAKVERYDYERAAGYYIHKLIAQGAILEFEGLERLHYSGPKDLFHVARINPYVPERLKEKVFGEYLVVR